MSHSPTENDRLHSLASLAHALGQSGGLDVMLEVASEEMIGALGAASVSISRLEPGSWTLRTLINVGQLGPGETRWPQSEVYRLEDYGHFRPVFHERQVWFTALDDVDADTADVTLLRALEKGSSLTAPLVVDGSVWGELYATWHATAADSLAVHVPYIEALTAILGGALSRTLQAERLERLASCDPLTGLANRRALDAAADQTFSSGGKGSRRRISAIAADVNGLKEVNDVHGHDEGDRLLVAVASLLVSHFKPLYGSLVARVGGDEFTVLVPGHALRAVTRAAEAVCNAAAELAGGAGVSCGVATSLARGGREDQRALFAAADAAMYHAKRDGSSRPVVASEVDPRPGLSRV